MLFRSGHGDIEMAVHTVREGARDFLQKPVDPEKLLKTVAWVVQEDCDRRAMPIDEAQWKQRYALLTERERDVILLVAKGKLNRQIALKLGISERTVQVHRLGAYRKLDVHNVASLAPLTGSVGTRRFVGFGGKEIGRSARMEAEHPKAHRRGE